MKDDVEGPGVSRQGEDAREVRTGEGEAEETPRGHESQPFIAGVPAGHTAPMDAVYFNLQSSVSELELWTVEELLWNYSTS